MIKKIKFLIKSMDQDQFIAQTLYYILYKKNQTVHGTPTTETTQKEKRVVSEFVQIPIVL